MTEKKVAILIPCYNEEITIETVINDCKKHAPYADIYVIDNNSTDKTAEIAKKNNAIVLYEPKRGKAHAVKKAFLEVDADIYVMIDGDDTYPLDQIDKIIQPIQNHEADMTVGDRHSLGYYQQENQRMFHGIGNTLVKKTINFLFKANLEDILSGYRGFSKKFVKNYPLTCEGFEIEAHLTIHALHYGFVIKEIPITFKDRPQGSESKLNTISDGMKVMKLILQMFKDNKPIAFFSIFSLIAFIVSMASGFVVIDEFARSHYITHVPLTILSSSSLILSFLFFISGLILDTLVKQDIKNYALHLLKNAKQ
jgi:glycosyltransferase involved in cell wall biosynthesis